MQQEIVQFTPPVSPEPYGELFALYAHLNLEKKRHQVLLERAMACYPAIRDRVKTQALIATPTAAEAGQGFLQLDDARLEAEIFCQLPPEHLRQAFIYFLAVGDCPQPETDSLVDLLIYDTWGTILVETARAQLERYLQQKDESLALSCSYGPGYFNIPRTMILSLRELVDPSKIGMEIMDNTLMLPQKSCAGVYLMATDDTGFPENQIPAL